MRILPIALLALILSMTGCSKSPSIEEQTKLLEYENCLALARERHNSANDDYNRNLIDWNEVTKRNLFDYPETYCEDKRP